MKRVDSYRTFRTVLQKIYKLRKSIRLHRVGKSVRELLIGRIIDDVQLLEQCPLLIVQFGNVFLDVFHASSFFDGWTLTDEGDLYIFSMHGGSIA